MSEAKNLSATGRRKNAVARVRMTEGSGQIVINGRSFEEYLPTLPRMRACQRTKSRNPSALSMC